MASTFVGKKKTEDPEAARDSGETGFVDVLVKGERESEATDSESDDSEDSEGGCGFTSEMPIENLVQNPHMPWVIASTSHDNVVKFWDFSHQVEVARNVSRRKKNKRTRTDSDDENASDAEKSGGEETDSENQNAKDEGAELAETLRKAKRKRKNAANFDLRPGARNGGSSGFFGQL